MKILLVGGTGVISSAVMNRLLVDGHSVFVLNRGRQKELIPDQVSLLQADINDRLAVERLISGKWFDVVVDFLCYSPKQTEYSIELFRKVCSQYIFISSCAVYQINSNQTAYTEDSPLINPLWQYSIDKVECEKIVRDLCARHDLKYTIVRPAVTYGNTRIPYGIMPAYGFHWTFIARILNNKPIITWNGGQNGTSILHVEDFAEGFAALCGNEKAYGEAFNISGDEYIQWKNVLSILGGLLDREPVTVDLSPDFFADQFPERRDEILGGRAVNMKVDNSKIKQLVPEFGTKTFLKEGLQKVLEHHRNNNYLRGIDYEFDGNMDRVVQKWVTVNSPQNSGGYKTSYIDYLGEATGVSRRAYLSAKHRDACLMKTWRLARCFQKKVRAKIKNMLDGK